MNRGWAAEQGRCIDQAIFISKTRCNCYVLFIFAADLQHSNAGELFGERKSFC
jgi:hypothetical protein